MTTVLVGVSSGIAAYKILDLVKKLRKKHNVIVVMTDSAKRMISPKEFAKASGNKVASELFPKGFDYKKVLKQRKVDHIGLADKAAVMVIAPCTANTLAKMAHGIGEDLLTTTVLATRASILLCPSMNVNMWKNKATQNNISLLKKRGFHFIHPEEGSLACGYTGVGRLADLGKIEKGVETLMKKRTQLKGKKIIVTAGALEEEIDDVRVLTNRSSGKMGIALAEECFRRGAAVTLIRGRTDVEPGVVVEDIKVNGSMELLDALKKNAKKAHIILHAAAVSDFLVRKRTGKISSQEELKLTLVPNIKIIDRIKKMKKNILLVGFKADTSGLQEKAKELLKKSQADFIVANNAKFIGSDDNQVTIVRKHGVKKLPKASKEVIASYIIDEVAK
ncbi:bifunctional phosphopantothenoylcysteine decarboxylase/phosphopantothenate--cysteine ligase CoaBC [Candidatus Woesearchaeota archaeon]|nr:bifunctional phosphopantothenoylcysteine decarboxylase/phosphopantothenate--cysteine ligase CoaBC [Candidatus Woesearchaeota archaeon]